MKIIMSFFFHTIMHISECPINSDIIFVLDDSGSVGPNNFDAMLNFSATFVSGLNIGLDDDLVGAITFEVTADMQFNLNTHTDRDSLVNAIVEIPYSFGGATNTADGLCLLVTQGFTAASGARNSSSVFRIAIVITDGQSNANSNVCGFANVFEAASFVHSVEPSILVFAIGVGNFNLLELQAIATGPDFVSELSSFSRDQLLQDLEQRQFQICFEGMYVYVNIL